MNEFSSLTDFHFLRPLWLLLMPLGALVLYVIKTRTAQTSIWQGLIAPHLILHLFQLKNKFELFHPFSAFVLVNIISSLALAGPSWQRESSPFAEDQTPLIILLDLSNSMNQKDVKPSRLIRTQHKIQDLMSLRANSPTALIVYAGTAHRVIPLTDDSNVITMLTNALTTQLMPKPGKFVERTIGMIEANMKIPGNILLMADGLGANSLARFGSYCAQSKNRFLVYGVGTVKPSTSKIGSDNEGLKKLANQCGGYFQAMTLDKQDVEILNQKIERNFTLAEDEHLPWKDMGYYLLYPLAFFSLLWFRSGWTLNWLIPIAFLAPAMYSSPTHAQNLTFLDLWMTKDQQGQYYSDQGKYSKAASAFRNPMRKGIAFYKAEEFDTAADIFATIDTTEGLFNRANALAHGRRYVVAVKTYDLVLMREKNHKGAIKNKRLVQKIIDEVNQMSAAQQPEIGEQSKELGDAPKTGEGAEKLAFDTQEIKQYSAQELINNQALNEIWMRQVEPDPANFLKVKFLMQQEGRTNP